jgi:hypothetical protein
MSAKYPRSLHLPWSPGGTSDDKRARDVSALVGAEIVITEKCDGSNLAYTRGGVFSRSHAGPPAHASFDLAKATHGRLRHLVPAGLTVFCEYCFAVHSIEYGGLPDASLVFGVRDDERGRWWSWDAVAARADELGLPTVPVLFRGRVDGERRLRELTEALAAGPSAFGGEREGVVVRAAGEFADEAFARHLAKWVRAGHVQTDEHWLHLAIRPQRLRKAPGLRRRRNARARPLGLTAPPKCPRAAPGRRRHRGARARPPGPGAPPFAPRPLVRRAVLPGAPAFRTRPAPRGRSPTGRFAQARDERVVRRGEGVAQRRGVGRLAGYDAAPQGRGFAEIDDATASRDLGGEAEHAQGVKELLFGRAGLVFVAAQGLGVIGRGLGGGAGEQGAPVGRVAEGRRELDEAVVGRGEEAFERKDALLGQRPFEVAGPPHDDVAPGAEEQVLPRVGVAQHGDEVFVGRGPRRSVNARADAHEAPQVGLWPPQQGERARAAVHGRDKVARGARRAAPPAPDLARGKERLTDDERRPTEGGGARRPASYVR